MALGSLCAGLAFGTAGTAAIHALQYPLGAATHTPHGYGIGLLAPYVLDHVRHGCEPDLAQVARALRVADTDTPVPAAARAAVDEIRRLADAVGIPRTLGEIGLDRAELPSIAADAASIARLMRNSPVELDTADLETILDRAWHGEGG